jgi:tRNA A-37 threonylcarbamoyl transferase component Bud32
MSILEEARRRGIPTARLAWGASMIGPRRAPVALLATRRIEGSVTLAEALGRSRRAGPGARERYDLLKLSGAAVRLAHDRGMDHADLNIGNILVRPSRGGTGARAGGAEVAGGGAWVIDLGVSKIGASLSPGRRAGNLVRLLRSAEKHLGRDPMRGRDAAAFLHGYLGRGGGERKVLRRALLPAIRRRLPSIALHRLGWALTRSASTRRSRPRPR